MTHTEFTALADTARDIIQKSCLQIDRADRAGDTAGAIAEQSACDKRLACLGMEIIVFEDDKMYRGKQSCLVAMIDAPTESVWITI